MPSAPRERCTRRSRVVAVSWAFASPKAPYGGPGVRPVVKVLVICLASWGLWVSGHHGRTVAFLIFSVGDFGTQPEVRQPETRAGAVRIATIGQRAGDRAGGGLGGVVPALEEAAPPAPPECAVRPSGNGQSGETQQ